MNVILFGRVNDPEIVRIELVVNEELTLEQTEFYDGLFVFHYENDAALEDVYGSQCYERLKAYDKKENLVYDTAVDP